MLQLIISMYFFIDPHPPPNGIHLEFIESNRLLFTWNKTNQSAKCSSIRYIITAKNCGVCPRNTTNTSIICSFSSNTHGNCMFAVSTEVCRSVVGERSEYIIVKLYGKYKLCLNLHK